MSKTLEAFLVRNTLYNASRACIMLVGATSSAMSNDSSPKLKPIKNDNIMNMMSTVESPSEDIIWPVRCLVKMAVVRNCLPSAMLMLNATIPNELRWRAPTSQGLASAPRPPLGLVLALVNVILESSATATRFFLNMMDGESPNPNPYWFSIDEDTKLALSLVSVHGKYVMLQEPEPRGWALDCLKIEIESATDSAYTSAKGPPLPDGWLKEVVSGAFYNAECDIGFGLDVNSVPRSILSIAGEVACYRQEMLRAGKLLVPHMQSCGLDFDLVISSLLLLTRKGCVWKDGMRFSAQTLLNTVCEMAGKNTRNNFMFDKSTVLRLCALSDNLQAAAFLVGGKKGLILECADLVVSTLAMTIKDAEMALFVGSLAELKVTVAQVYEEITQDQESMFTPSVSHQHIMWLLEEHVLNVHTYGAFDSSLHSGKIGPVFAGRVCFRAWYCLTHPSVRCTSAKWLERWMRRKLELTKGTSRLACAALVRTLLWADESGGLDLSESGDEPLLAAFIGFDGQFMAELAQACCGLIHSIPPHLAEELMSSFGCSNMVSFEASLISSTQ